MTRKPKSDDDEWYRWESPFVPELTVYEKGKGLQSPIGFVHFKDPPKPKRKRVIKKAAKKTTRKRAKR